MKEIIRKIKLSRIKYPEDMFLTEIFGNLIEYKSEIFPQSVFYKYNNNIIFEYNLSVVENIPLFEKDSNGKEILSGKIVGYNKTSPFIVHNDIIYDYILKMQNKNCTQIWNNQYTSYIIKMYIKNYLGLKHFTITQGGRKWLNIIKNL